MDRVQAAFEATPRESFLPADVRREAWRDMPLTIGWGATNSQPSTVRAMLHLLDVPAGGQVLDIGTGSGWTTALLAHLVGAEGDVVGVELVPELVEFGRSNLERVNRGWAQIHPADQDVFGFPQRAPYDRILVSAMADEIPPVLVDQLARGGILVIPVAGRMLRVVRTDDGYDVDEHGSYVFVPLR